jgi:hypothetical protein
MCQFGVSGWVSVTARQAGMFSLVGRGERARSLTWGGACGGCCCRGAVCPALFHCHGNGTSDPSVAARRRGVVRRRGRRAHPATEAPGTRGGVGPAPWAPARWRPGRRRRGARRRAGRAAPGAGCPPRGTARSGRVRCPAGGGGRSSPDSPRRRDLLHRSVGCSGPAHGARVARVRGGELPASTRRWSGRRRPVRSRAPGPGETGPARPAEAPQRGLLGK